MDEVRIIEERVKVREKNQITIPKRIADIRNIRDGREVIAHVDDERPNEIILRVIPDTYAGALTDVFNGVDVIKYAEEERASWD